MEIITIINNYVDMNRWFPKGHRENLKNKGKWALGLCTNPNDASEVLAMSNLVSFKGNLTSTVVFLAFSSAYTGQPPVMVVWSHGRISWFGWCGSCWPFTSPGHRLLLTLMDLRHSSCNFNGNGVGQGVSMGPFHKGIDWLDFTC